MRLFRSWRIWLGRIRAVRLSGGVLCVRLCRRFRGFCLGGRLLRLCQNRDRLVARGLLRSFLIQNLVLRIVVRAAAAAIAVGLIGASAAIGAVRIAGEVLANEVAKAEPSGYVKEWKINGEAVTMGVEKEGK